MALSQVPIGQNETTTTISALVERVASLDIYVKNLEVKFQCSSLKRKDFDDRIKKMEDKSKEKYRFILRSVLLQHDIFLQSLSR